MRYVGVKICGITNVEDALAAARLGADFIGLNFYPGSSRCISEAQARLILHALPKPLVPVALFVNETWEQIRTVAVRLGLNWVQVHGDQLQPCPFADLRWIPAFPIRDASRLTVIRDFVESCAVERRPAGILLDAHVPGSYGGTGQTAPWDLVRGLHVGVPLILAGGLTPENVKFAVLNALFPYAVDVASGVESSPGVKDHDKMRRFIENARSAADG